jgi:hypothetical protein
MTVLGGLHNIKSAMIRSAVMRTTSQPDRRRTTLPKVRLGVKSGVISTGRMSASASSGHADIIKAPTAETPEQQTIYRPRRWNATGSSRPLRPRTGAGQLNPDLAAT